MPTSSSDRYSAVSSSSSSSTSSSNSCYNNTQNHHSHTSVAVSPPSRTFLPLRSATSSFHLSKLNSTNYRSMQSLKIQQQCRVNPPPVARISPLIVDPSRESLQRREKQAQNMEDGWLSCEELETIEKRFTDLLQEPPSKKSSTSIHQQQDKRAKSCDRLTIDSEDDLKPALVSSKW